MDKQSSDLKERFINDYVAHTSRLLDITDEERLNKIKQIAEERFVDTDLVIYNTDKFTEKKIGSTDFWYDRGKYVLNENGVLFDTTERNEAVTASLISQNIDLRQVFKKAKKKAAEINDTIAEKKHGTFEALTKLMINGFYGLTRQPHTQVIG